MGLANEPRGLGTATAHEQLYPVQERAKRLRDRAEELRALSEGMDFTAARKSVGQIAAVFEKLATKVESQSR